MFEFFINFVFKYELAGKVVKRCWEKLVKMHDDVI